MFIRTYTERCCLLINLSIYAFMHFLWFSNWSVYMDHIYPWMHVEYYLIFGIRIQVDQVARRHAREACSCSRQRTCWVPRMHRDGVIHEVCVKSVAFGSQGNNPNSWTTSRQYLKGRVLGPGHVQHGLTGIVSGDLYPKKRTGNPSENLFAKWPSLQDK